MVPRWARVLAAGLALSFGATPVAPGQAADFVSIENVTAVAQTYVSTCPWDPAALNVGDICVDTDVSIFRARRAGQAGPPTPWMLFVIEYTGEYVSVEEGLQLRSTRFGFTPAESGYVDPQHMVTATARGAVPMSEGDEISVDLRWDLSTADVQVSGTQGPTEEYSWGRHGLDGCTVVNLLAHQRWRIDYGGVSGTLGGSDISEKYLPTEFPSVFIGGRSTFKVIINDTGAECPPS